MFLYIARDNPKAAQAFVEELNAKIEWIAETGYTGHPRDYIRPGLRAYPYRGRCVYFRLMEDEVVISRVLHGKMDVWLQDFPEE